MQRTEEDFIGTGRTLSFLDALMRGRPWVERAACKDSGVLFIVEPSSGRELASSVVRALEVCQGCPVRPECLRDALEARFTAVGVWGGSTMVERRALMPRPKRLTDDRFEAATPTQLKKIDAAVVQLEQTFEKRLRRWKRLARKPAVTPVAV